MEFLVIAIASLIVGMLLRYLFDFSLKEIKKLAEKPDLDKIIEKYPTNQQVAKEMLKKLNNEKVKIEENEKQKVVYMLLFQIKYLLEIFRKVILEFKP